MSALGRENVGSAAQQDRRRRILETTYELASQGGFEAVQMRAVAEKADVALGTLYRYFPSKIHLLVSTLAALFQVREAYLLSHDVPGDSAADRVVNMLSNATTWLQREPDLTEALTRAFMFADNTVLDEIHQVGLLMTNMVTRAMHGDEYDPTVPPTEDDVTTARVLCDVWMAALMAWVTQRFTADEVDEHLARATRLVLR